VLGQQKSSQSSVPGCHHIFQVIVTGAGACLSTKAKLFSRQYSAGSLQASLGENIANTLQDILVTLTLTLPRTLHSTYLYTSSIRVGRLPPREGIISRISYGILALLLNSRATPFPSHTVRYGLYSVKPSSTTLLPASIHVTFPATPLHETNIPDSTSVLHELRIWNPGLGSGI